jgi:hypothetical protein
MPHPFGFENLIHLLEYLAMHSAQPPAFATFSAKMALETDGDFHDSLTDHLDGALNSDNAELTSITFRCNVEGVAGIANLFHHTPYTVEKVEWRAHGNDVRIDCVNREVHIATDSISFVELCRHKMTGQRVRKFTVSLKIQ